MTELQDDMKETLITLTSDIVAAHLSNNSVTVDDVPSLISNVFSALAGLGEEAKPEEKRPDPAVSIRASVKPDYIVCLEDGKKLKMLKRHLMTHYNMTPEDYRQRWGLPADYPMVAPNYAEKRRDLAKKIGLGRKPAATPAAKPAEKAAATPAAKPATKPTAKAKAKPAAKATAKAAAKPAAKPAQKRTRKAKPMASA